MDEKYLSDDALLQELEYVLQKHTQASKGGRSHADFRFGNAKEGLESYAIPKSRLPALKERLLAVNTVLHPFEYRKFQGVYGKGKGLNSVEIVESGKLTAKNDEDGSKTLEISEDFPKRRFKLVRTRNNGKDSWLIIGIDPVEKTAAEKAYKIVPGSFIDCRTAKKIANLCIFQCLTANSLKKGLGGRASWPFGLGMLFLNCRSFWMKDVQFGLDLVFLDKDFVVTEIIPMRGSLGWFDLPVYKAKKRQSIHALEVPEGYCAVKGIHVGDLLRVKK